MDEKRLPDGFPLGFIEKKTFGRVYMRAVENEFRAKHPGRDFDDTLWNTCGLSPIYLEGDEDYFHLDNFIQKMGLDEAAIKAECEEHGFDYAGELGTRRGLPELRKGEELRILAASNGDSPEDSPLLLGLCRFTSKSEEAIILKLWTVDVEDGKLWTLRDFPLYLHQSFYAHSCGVYSVNVPCPAPLTAQVHEVLAGEDWNGKWEKEEEE